MSKRTRIPSDLLWIVFWCLFGGGLSLFVAVVAPSRPLRLIYAGLAAFYLASAVGLYRMSPWSRITAGSTLLLAALVQAVGFRKGFDWARLCRVGMNLWWGVYLFLPSTRQMFAQSSGARFSRIGCLVQLLFMALILVVVSVAVHYQLPGKVWIPASAVVVIPMMFFEDRITTWLSVRFGPKPDDLDRAAWAAFQTAFAAWRDKDLDRAESLLQALAPGLSVRTLRGLIRMDRAKTSSGLDRILYDSFFLAAPGDREGILEECRRPDLDQRIADRAALLDDLLEDDVRLYPLFTGEIVPRFQDVTGRIFLSNAESQHREDWKQARPRCTGSRARDWLTVRLWDAQCQSAAVASAETSTTPGMKDLADLIARLQLIEGTRPSEGWFLVNAPNLCLLPLLSDAACLLHLDSPYIEMLSPETVSSRLSARIEYIAQLRRLREEYPSDSRIEIPWLLALLVGEPADKIPGKKRFERWWAERRAAQHGFDGAFVTGLEAFRKEDWARAEEAFAEAAAAWPTRTCATYNRALALLHLSRGPEAERLFLGLSEKSPDEAVYWMRIGDARRLQGRVREALDAFQRAAKLGGLEEKVSLRLGMTLASEGREDEAVKQLEAAAGPDADADRLDQLAGFLEAEGIYKLASRYREQAFLKRLTEKPSGEEVDPDEEDLEASG